MLRLICRNHRDYISLFTITSYYTIYVLSHRHTFTKCTILHYNSLVFVLHSQIKHTIVALLFNSHQFSLASHFTDRITTHTLILHCLHLTFIFNLTNLIPSPISNSLSFGGLYLIDLFKYYFKLFLS